ncbi:2,3-bisphosphoglycerate-independent phosphoglycerate mutase [bacterium]|nr:2,3-bisphosphoglycerate-independent phosphoglycerate mutase [bacterium]
MPPVMLVILDGFGVAPPGPGNAVELANTPNFDRYRAQWPHTELQASGRSVGLPAGQMGNSEVGHLNLGSGRVVMQSLTYVDSTIEDGSFFENQALKDCCQQVKASGGTLHLGGLVSRGGVHSELGHVLALVELARRQGISRLRIHVFSDGRDTPPDSGLGYVGELEDYLSRGGGDYRIATVCGRYYAMDRDRRWERQEKAYSAVVSGRAEFHAASAREAISMAYQRGETDEFILPTIVGPSQEMEAGDGWIFFNFRADRARQLSSALLGGSDWTEFARSKVVTPLHFVSLMPYDAKLQRPVAFALPPLSHCLAEVISQAGKRQYHTAETEKYPHVTYFFNATVESLFEGEERHMVASPKVATYDLQPEMSAPQLTADTLARLRQKADDFVLINFANPDMVGHTGVIPAAIAACEASDKGLGVLVEEVLSQEGTVIVLADHGNAEVMIDEHGAPHTAHTTNPVPCLLIGGPPGVELRAGGVLADVAPTVLDLMGLEPPVEMTGRSLLERAKVR